MYLIDFIFRTRLHWYFTLLAGAVAIMGIVAAVTALFPSADEQTIAAIGAFGLGALLVILFWKIPVPKR